MTYPPHPGLKIKQYLADKNISVKDAAKMLKIARPNFNNVLNGKSGISPVLAIKLEYAFGFNAYSLAIDQAFYDLEKEYKKGAS